MNRDKAESWEYINVPVKKATIENNIQEIEILHEEGWADKLKKKLTFRYSKAPYFREVKDLLFATIDKGNGGKLSEFNIYSIRQICDYSDVGTRFIDSSILDCIIIWAAFKS